MRIEIILPDSTSLATVTEIQALAKRLSARPELVHQLLGVAERQAAYSVSEDGAVFHADGTVTLTPAHLAEARSAATKMRQGMFLTDAEVDQSLEATREKWRKAHPES